MGTLFRWITQVLLLFFLATGGLIWLVFFSAKAGFDHGPQGSCGRWEHTELL